MKKKTNKKVLESGLAMARAEAARASHCICPECGNEGHYLATSYKGHLRPKKCNIYMCSCRTKWEVSTGERKKFQIKKFDIPAVVFAMISPVIIGLFIIGFLYTIEGFLPIGIPCLLTAMILTLILMYSNIDNY